MRPATILRLSDPPAVARAAATRFVEAGAEAVRAGGRFVAVLSGGSTPRALYGLLASSPEVDRVPWSRTALLFGDERCVPPDHERSNYRMVREALLDRLPAPPGSVHRMEGERPPVEAAARYEKTLRGLFQPEAAPRFDLLLLGMGDDGHTASLFPDTRALEERERWVVANHVPAPDSWRITLTVPALCAAKRVLFLITGTAKARVVAEAFGGLEHEPPHPVEGVVPVNGSLEVLLDEAAASLLPG